LETGSVPGSDADTACPVPSLSTPWSPRNQAKLAATHTAHGRLSSASALSHVRADGSLSWQLTPSQHNNTGRARCVAGGGTSRPWTHDYHTGYVSADTCGISVTHGALPYLVVALSTASCQSQSRRYLRRYHLSDEEGHLLLLVHQFRARPSFSATCAQGPNVLHENLGRVPYDE
jgi:hypothetical protein